MRRAFSPCLLRETFSYGVAIGWYEVAPLALPSEAYQRRAACLGTAYNRSGFFSNNVTHKIRTTSPEKHLKDKEYNSYHQNDDQKPFYA